MIGRNVKLVFSTNALILCSGVVTSLLSSWALGPSGRGDFIIVLTWPAVFALVMEIGLPQAHRYWTAKRPESVSALFSNGLIFSILVGAITLALGEWLIPSLVGERSPEVMRLVRIYAVIIPLTFVTDFMRTLLEGARKFDWVGGVRLIFFAVQLSGFVALWFLSRLTVANATYTMIASYAVSMIFALVAVWREFAPAWRPQVSELKNALRFGLRDYPGVLTEFASWRLDSLLLAGIGSSASVGLYSVAVRISDITTVMASSVSDALMPEVAASRKRVEATQVVTRSLRQTLMAHLTVIVPLWLVAPHVLRIAYGDSFVPATNTLRLLMIASVVWSAGAIVISGLNGLGHPGLSATARISAALVLVVTLLSWMPTRGIQGAAMSSITGYSVMFLVSLFWLSRSGRISIWECLRPRWSDVPNSIKPANLQALFGKYTGRAKQTHAPAELLITGVE